jgi:TetR/AcrR family transcriptional regulator
VAPPGGGVDSAPGFGQLAGTRAPKTRDALRSREAILDAAERLFAERGFDGASLADIGAAAGVSRGTPGYFFGSKEGLYSAVLERVFTARDAALEPAFAPLAEWGASRPGETSASLEDVLAQAIDGYLRFLYQRPNFVALIEREAIEGAERLAATPHESTVIRDALTSLRRGARRHGLRQFDVPSVKLCLVALCFFPLAHRRTLLPAIGLDPNSPRFLAERRDAVLEVLLHLIRGDAQPAPRSGNRGPGAV